MPICGFSVTPWERSPCISDEALHMSIDIDSCAELETIIVTTRSSVYELIVLPGRESVLLRGGSHFTIASPSKNAR